MYQREGTAPPHFVGVYVPLEGTRLLEVAGTASLMARNSCAMTGQPGSHFFELDVASEAHIFGPAHGHGHMRHERYGSTTSFPAASPPLRAMKNEVHGIAPSAHPPGLVVLGLGSASGSGSAARGSPNPKTPKKSELICWVRERTRSKASVPGSITAFVASSVLLTSSAMGSHVPSAFSPAHHHQQQQDSDFNLKSFRHVRATSPALPTTPMERPGPLFSSYNEANTISHHPRARARERTAWRATRCHVPRGAGAPLVRGFSGVWHSAGTGGAAAAAACGKEQGAVVWGGGVE
ncbi:hypothetical protein CONPUDRAFT_158700 [Coniophora puteana RWD-64-598 SS2]|uniref:Uncharacterized protein n=1 Tax=Coniophora puteana (strain RWD-64-598) TaxID=741705 RepID=A0A5M3MBC1_CONPW|nr:uncharacterized protein CONPUDRAFT_158700 [Coniophora puteana RWD-64-598 SS2]EIW75921.1 hypothetical protein CONPUDRAFT_158700 [Coniophora puteana RWD-64-598 SS2]